MIVHVEDAEPDFILATDACPVPTVKQHRVVLGNLAAQEEALFKYTAFSNLLMKPLLDPWIQDTMVSLLPYNLNFLWRTCQPHFGDFALQIFNVYGLPWRCDKILIW